MKISRFHIPLAIAMLCCVGLPVIAQPFKSAQWITVPYNEGKSKRICPLFEKAFDIHTTITKAVLTVTALGLYEAELNGKRLGDAYFTPGFTAYNKRLQYQQYEVTKLLKQRNKLQILIGEGWYRGKFRNDISDQSKNNFGSQAALLCELDITYQDGSHYQIATGPDWKCQKSGVLYSELYDGEMQDTRNTLQKLLPVKALNATVNLVSQECEYVKKHESLKPINIFRTPKGEQVVDFGQNLAGWVKIIMKGKAGDTIRLNHAEVLDSLDNFYTGNLRSAKAEDVYILNGKEQILEPHFTYHGFRYVRLKGFDASKAKLQAIALYTDLRPTGSLSCSDTLINKLYKNITWSLKSNFVDIPTDCPQRSERLGWTGDAQVFAATAMYLYDTKQFYSKWLRDVAVEQGSNGAVPNYVPRSSPGTKENYGVAGWGDAATIIPAALYQTYGDIAALRQQYPAMKKWVDYITSVSKDGFFINNGYGDWYAKGPATSIPFLDQCFYANSTRLLLEAAIMLKEKTDIQKYDKLYEAILNRFQETYGSFSKANIQTQTAYVLALAFDLLPESKRSEIADLLAENIKANGNRLATGFLGTPYLLPVLTRFGYNDLAYILLQQQACPSWLYPITKGATTIWERWDAVKPDGSIQPVSFNHYSYGAVGQWLFETMVGIQAVTPGYQTIHISPRPGGTLTWAKGSYRSGFGLISSSWQKQGTTINYAVVIPKGTTAIIDLVGRKPFTVKSGTYHFKTNI